MNKLIENRIKKFKNYLDNANESLNNIIDMNWIKKDDDEWNGDFVIDDKIFNILIKRVVLDSIIKEDFVYLTKFGLKNGDDINYKKLTDNNTHRSLTTLATIRHNLKIFIKEQKPKVLTFITSDSDETRIKLYQRFCDEIIDNNKNYFSVYHVYNKLPIFIICNVNYNVLKVSNFYINLYKLYKLYYNF